MSDESTAAAVEPSARNPQVAPGLQAAAVNTATENEIDQSINQQLITVAGSNAKNNTSLAENIASISKGLAAVESPVAGKKYNIEKTLTLKAMPQVNTATIAVSDGDENNQQLDENIKNIDTESAPSKLQHPVEKYQKPQPVQSVASIATEMNALYQSKLASAETTDQTYAIWSVYLSSYYGKPPPAGELDFLDQAGVPYQIKKTSVNGADWYRILVNNSTEYKAAKEYAEMLKARLRLKKIWISQKTYSYE